MPSYDLICKQCGYKFSVFCSISQKDNQQCQQCGSKEVSQRFTSVNIGGSSGGGGKISAAPSGGFG